MCKGEQMMYLVRRDATGDSWGKRNPTLSCLPWRLPCKGGPLTYARATKVRLRAESAQLVTRE